MIAVAIPLVRGPHRGAAAVWRHLGEHSRHACERDAAWRVEAFGLRQGPVDVRARGLHRRCEALRLALLKLVAV
jgi:hypothetical protein